jgi:hypothetical protein
MQKVIADLHSTLGRMETLFFAIAIPQNAESNSLFGFRILQNANTFLSYCHSGERQKQ